MENIYLSLAEYGWIGIALAALSEGIFLPLPMETVSIPIYLLNRERAFLLSLLLVLFSIVGSIIGYHIGKYFGSGLLKKFAPKNSIEKLGSLYEKNAFLTLLTSAFSPIAYEAYVISAGSFKVNFKKFIFAAAISRIIRHLPLGLLFWLYGESVLLYFKKYFIVAAILILTGIAIKFFKNRTSTV